MKIRSRKLERGFTISELLVGLVLFSSLTTMTVTQLFQSSSVSKDLYVESETDQIARDLFDLIAYDLRVTGSGMPLGQLDFSSTDALIGDAALPVLLTSDQDTISLRFTEWGRGTVLEVDYTPDSISALTFEVDSISDFLVDDLIYISDMSQGGSAGMQATITAISGNHITVDSAFIATAGITLLSGSTVYPVKTITYQSLPAGAGITRNDGSGDVMIEQFAEFSVDYVDAAASSLTLPLTASTVRNQLEGIELDLTVNSLRLMKDGSRYEANIAHTIALRNLIMNR